MAEYTVELREFEYFGVDFKKECLSDYPVFDEAFRSVLNDRIYEYFKFREIGYETISLFVDRFRAHLFRAMPAYNRLFEADKLLSNPLITQDVVTSMSSEADTVSGSSTMSESSSSTSSSADSKSRTSEHAMPQTQLAEGQSYETGAADSLSRSESAGSGAENSTVKTKGDGRQTSISSSHTKGYTGSQAALITEYRDALINVTNQLCEELSVHFMNVWGTRQNYAPYRWY